MASTAPRRPKQTLVHHTSSTAPPHPCSWTSSSSSSGWARARSPRCGRRVVRTLTARTTGSSTPSSTSNSATTARTLRGCWAHPSFARSSPSRGTHTCCARCRWRASAGRCSWSPSGATTTYCPSWRRRGREGSGGFPTTSRARRYPISPRLSRTATTRDGSTGTSNRRTSWYAKASRSSRTLARRASSTARRNSSPTGARDGTERPSSSSLKTPSRASTKMCQGGGTREPPTCGPRGASWRSCTSGTRCSAATPDPTCYARWPIHSAKTVASTKPRS